jgi:cytoskeleton protein RodZ
VFEIGSSLREARMRRKLELSQVEQDTRIRAKYLMALEDDRFEALPEPAYAKGFLRTYADYLGLDAQRVVDDYNTHFAPQEEPAAPPPVRIRRRRLGLDYRLLAVPVAAVLVGLIAWQLSRSGSHPQAASRPPPPTTRTTTPAPTPAPPTGKHPATVARIVLAAARGRCWLSVHIGSARGTSVFERTLQPGQTARFVSRRLWIRIGAPWNLDASLNGKSVQLPASTASVVVTSTGINVVR